MTSVHPLRWITEQAKTGVKELPSNASWLLSGGESTGDVASGARERASKLKDSVVNASPLGGDSIEDRLEDAREQTERAFEAEQEALALAREAEETAEHARQISELGSRRVEDAESEGDRAVDEKVADARREADAWVEAVRNEARADADHDLQEVREEARSEAHSAQADAEQAQERAEEAMAEAAHSLADARRLADEAEQAARDTAEQAHQEAERLADEAKRDATAAAARAAAAERVREGAGAPGSSAGIATNGELKSLSKAELLDLAATIDIPGRSRMSKAALASAIARSARGAQKAA